MNSASVIDLRSDTVTLPSKGMRRAIADAEVGDDVLDGDPTTKRLEDRLAELLGHEAALFFPTGTQANQTAVALHADRGTEVVVEAKSHLLHYERGAAAAFWGVQLREVVTPDGILTPDLVRAKIRDGSADFPRTSAVVIENTHSEAGGKVTDLATMRGLRELCDAQGVAIHIDGARLWNAHVASGTPLAEFAAVADTVMVALSKGMRCPAGSLVIGTASDIVEARRLRKVLGGGMRQAGIIAAAGLVALDTMVDRLGEDHDNARALARGPGGFREVRRTLYVEDAVRVPRTRTRWSLGNRGRERERARASH